jgi:hypothetical protein
MDVTEVDLSVVDIRVARGSERRYGAGGETSYQGVKR